MFGLTLDQLLVAALVAFGLPPLVALATSWRAPAQLKATVLIVLSVIATAVQTILWQDHVDWKSFVSATLGQIALAVLAHFGITKPIGLSGSESVPARKGLTIGSPE